MPRGTATQADYLSRSQNVSGLVTATLLRLLPPCQARIRHHPPRPKTGRTAAHPDLTRVERRAVYTAQDASYARVCKEQGRIHRLVMTGDY